MEAEEINILANCTMFLKSKNSPLDIPQTLAAAIDSAEVRKLKHIDLRHSRIPEAGKKVKMDLISKCLKPT